VVLGAAAVLAAVAGGSALHGFYRLFTSFGMDQGSPTPSGQLWIAAAGIVAGISLAASLATAARGYFNDRVVAVLIVAILACTVPLWRRASTIDVIDTGFRHAKYIFETRDFRIYNATSAPIRICLGTGGVCAAEAGDAHRLGAPGLIIATNDAAWVGWPRGASGKFSLTVADPPPTMTRPVALLDVRELPKSDHNNDPFPDPFWYQPPPYQPPQFQPPLR
jgi:hypothetical protein